MCGSEMQFGGILDGEHVISRQVGRRRDAHVPVKQVVNLARVFVPEEGLADGWGSEPALDFLL